MNREPTLDLAYGAVSSPQTQHLVDALIKLDFTGSIYVGYPVLKVGDDQVVADALLTALECGVVLFDLSPPQFKRESTELWLTDVRNRQDGLYRSFYNKLLPNQELALGRGLAFEIHVVTFVPDRSILPLGTDGVILADANSIHDWLLSLPPIDACLFERLNAAIQRTRTIKPRSRRSNVQRTDSRGAILKRIEAEIANLDAWQKKGAIEFPEGPQRIRGLAGSGKTIVLALKAAYLHATHPEWNIGVTFQTRSLYQQFIDHIRRFSFETIEDEPDWEKLRILHAWGGSEPGVYSEISSRVGLTPRNWTSARASFGDSAFEGICGELLQHIRKLGSSVPQMFDAILIDEAQDFPADFFQLVYSVCSPEKRIVWAYDELQNLGQYAMLPPTELFGLDANGRPLVELRNEAGRPEQDIVLPVCYRNTPWALTVAHALGFGIYRKPELVQMFDDTSLWENVGYEVKSGQLALGQWVNLKRRPECAPKYFEELIRPEDAIACYGFVSEKEQAVWVADQIRRDIHAEELLPRDILIVLPDTITAKSTSATYMQELDKLGIESHLAGVTTSRDVLFLDDSVAITQIYRAKGNEAAVVYLVNADYCYSGSELKRRRNTLFTAITRSKAWVRVCGVGSKMDLLMEEFNKVRERNFTLDFKYPTAGEISRMERVHRDLEPAERAKLNKEFAAAQSLLEQIDAGDLGIDALPDNLKALLERISRQSGER